MGFILIKIKNNKKAIKNIKSFIKSQKYGNICLSN